MKTSSLIIGSIFAAILCIFSPITIPVGTVPITMSLFGVVLCSVVLGCRLSLAAVGVYVCLGAVGLPVFAGFQGGIGVLLGPTGGFIWSYFVYCVFVGNMSCKRQHSEALIYISSFVSLIVTYIAGTLQFSVVQSVSVSKSLIVCVLPFAVFDILKIICAVKLGIIIKNRLKSHS